MTATIVFISVSLVCLSKCSRSCNWCVDSRSLYFQFIYIDIYLCRPISLLSPIFMCSNDADGYVQYLSIDLRRKAKLGFASHSTYAVLTLANSFYCITRHDGYEYNEQTTYAYNLRPRRH
ncbi:hypothetical protein GGR55DRAFT_393644 [Xylaria sp. FL0064]|nr:hypothetical protein GGR55DRAFT_393644 [Xylaria sp. FL0064]